MSVKSKKRVYSLKSPCGHSLLNCHWWDCGCSIYSDCNVCHHNMRCSECKRTFQGPTRAFASDINGAVIVAHGWRVDSESAIDERGSADEREEARNRCDDSSDRFVNTSQHEHAPMNSEGSC